MTPLIRLAALAAVASATSTLFVPQTNTTVSVHLPAGSPDVLLSLSSPDWFQYTAVGFGDSMRAGAFMLVFYASDVAGEVTVSPRMTIETHREPLPTQSNRITVHPSGTGIAEHMMLANITCHGCREYLPPGTPAQVPMIFANGPGTVPLATASRDAFLRRHVAHGIFTVDAKQAAVQDAMEVKIGWDGMPVTVGATLQDGAAQVTGGSKAGVAHGVVLTVAALGVMPVDAVVGMAASSGRGSGGRLSRWGAGLSMGLGTVVVVLVAAGLAVGVGVSGEVRMTASMQTPHQILGLIVTTVVFALFLLGVALAVMKARAAKSPNVAADGTVLPPKAVGGGLPGRVHQWGQRLVWALMLVTGGLGLQLAERGRMFMMGYGVLIGAVLLVMVPVWFCVWRCSKHRKEKAEEEEYELHQQQQYSIYNHDRY